MKKSHLLAILAAAVLLTSLVVCDASAQQPVRTAMRPTTQAAAPLIALLDVSYIFKNHGRFKAMMDDMKSDVQRAEAQVKQETEALQKLAESAQDYRKGTPDYKAIEEEVAKRRATITVRVQLQKREFIEQEAKIYHNIYLEICGSNLTRFEIEWMIAEVGADRVIFGTDMPWIDPRFTLGKVAYANLSDEQRRLVLGENMARLLRMP